MFATNSSVVMRSLDTGCTWSEVYAVPDHASADFPAESRITSIVIPEAPSPRVYLTLFSDPQIMRIVRSDNFGDTWSAADLGVPPLSGLPLLKAAPSEPDVLYLSFVLGGSFVPDIVSGDEFFGSFQGRAPLVRPFYRSEDGGRTWMLRSNVAMQAPDQSLLALNPAFVVDPLEPDVLWTWDGGPLLRRSDDGGATWATVAGIPPDNEGLLSVDVAHRPGEPSRILASTKATPTARDGFVFLSRDGGATWTRPGAPPRLWFLAHGWRGDKWVALQQGQVSEGTEPATWTFDDQTLSWALIPPPTDDPPRLKDVMVDRTSAPSIFAQTPESIERYDGERAENVIFPACVPPPVWPEPPDLTGVLTPQGNRIVLEPGTSETIRYILDLPPVPKPMDVYFLVDTSSSMDWSIAAVRENLKLMIARLKDAIGDVHFGVGEYHDYPIPPYGTEGDYAYRRALDLGPPGPRLTAAIGSLVAEGGLDGPESQLAALLQTATGSGQDLPPAKASSADIPPCIQANFRSGALKVIVHITDAQFHDEPGYPGPTWQETINALVEREILQVGIATGYEIHTGYSDQDLSRIARATGTLASEPVDCDGDGEITREPYPVDRIAGEPLVCQGWDLAPAIVRLLKAIRDEADVRLVEQGAGGVVTGIAPVYHDVNMRVPNRLSFDVTFGCGLRQDGIHVTALAAEVRGSPVALTGVEVDCRSRPAGLPIPLRIGIAPPPIPPAPIPEPASHSQGQGETQANPQSQSQTQGAPAPERQEEPQVALAQALDAAQEETSYAMTRSGSSGLRLAGSAFVLALAAAWLAASWTLEVLPARRHSASGPLRRRRTRR